MLLGLFAVCVVSAIQKNVLFGWARIVSKSADPFPRLKLTFMMLLGGEYFTAVECISSSGDQRSCVNTI
jgi:hypothetical protein